MITELHGGQREEESQPAAWPQHPGELSGQLQVRAPVEEAWGRSGASSLPACRAGGCEWAMSQRCSAELKVLMLAARIRCRCVWPRSAVRIKVAMYCWVACLGLGVSLLPEDWEELYAACTQRNHTLQICRLFWLSAPTKRISAKTVSSFIITSFKWRDYWPIYAIGFPYTEVCDRFHQKQLQDKFVIVSL